MIAALIELFTTPALLIALILAVPLGLAFGCVPGLGGKIAIISLMPLTFGLDPAVGCVFLLSVHAVVHTGGAVPAVLFAVPGTGPSTAIVMDGHALAKKGQAVRAIAASSVASAIGGLIGAVCLALFIPFALAIMKVISYPEMFVLSLFGVSIAAALSGKAPLRGAISGCFGVVLSLVGTAPADGALRLTFGVDLLWDGLNLVILVLALFAIPEMISLAAGQSPKPQAASTPTFARDMRQVVMGAVDVVRNWWLTLRTSVLGTLIGIIPGLGGETAAWLCYAHAAQTSKPKTPFGDGAIEGIIGPEAANNSKEGGALAPTLMLGLPGSTGMAVLLVAFQPLGITPGPALIETQSQLLWLMVWALVFSNLVAAVVLVGLTPLLGFISRLEVKVLAPFVILLSFVSIHLSTYQPGFFLVAAGLGLVGYAMMRAGWPRAPFAIGAVLGPVAEDALYKSIALWGPAFLLRPGTLALIAVLCFVLWRLRVSFKSSMVSV